MSCLAEVSAGCSLRTVRQEFGPRHLNDLNIVCKEANSFVHIGCCTRTFLSWTLLQARVKYYWFVHTGSCKLCFQKPNLYEPLPTFVEVPRQASFCDAVRSAVQASLSLHLTLNGSSSDIPKLPRARAWQMPIGWPMKGSGSGCL